MDQVRLWSALLVLGGGAAWLFRRLRRVARIGAAYKAKVLASIVFGTGRTIDLRQTDEVQAESYWPMRFLRTHVNRHQRTVTVSLLGLWPRTAVYRTGLGATLAAPGGIVGMPGSPAAIPADSSAGSANGAADGSAGRAGRPATDTDRWPESVQSEALRTVVEAAFSEPDPRRLRRTRAIVVVKDGRIVAERYARGFGASTRFAGWSMTKSVLSALVGILVGQGRLSLEEHALLPHWRSPDPRAEIRLEDLLRMRSGLRFSEVYSDTSSDVVEMLFNRPDAAAYAADQPLASRPGTVWSYSSGTTNIIAGLVRRAVGDAEYLGWPRRMLFDPIGMTSAIIEPDASGTFVGSSFMFATARDWARFGQLYLLGGAWDGRRIVPEGWVGFSTSPTPQSPDGIYGAHWWLKLQPEFGGATAAAARVPSDAFFALGHEGQTLTVIPSQRLVVVRLGLSIHLDTWNHAGFLADLLDAL